jgi:hypothetical protein
MTPRAATAAEDLPLDFTWTAPDSCPSRAEVIEELSKAVKSGGKELPPLTARAVVEQDGATWRLELTTEIDGVRGTRVLEADSCQGLARAATLVMALTLGEGLARRQQAEVEAKARQPNLPEPKAPPEPLPPPAPQHAPERTRVLLWAAAAAGTDPLGEFGPGLALGFAVQPNLLRIGTRLEVTFPRSSEFAASSSSSSVRSFGFNADLQACLAPTLHPFQLSVCAVGGVSVLDVTGQGTARDGRATVPLYGIGPGVGMLWLLTDSAFLNLGVLSRFFLKRPELVIEDLPQRRQIEALSVSADLGVGVRF